MAARLHPLLTFLFAGLILLFTGGPVLLSLYGSLVPDRILFDPADIQMEQGCWPGAGCAERWLIVTRDSLPT